MENARRHVPAGAWFQLVGSREEQYPVIPSFPVVQAGLEFVLGRARVQAEEGIGKIPAVIVELLWKIVRFRLTRPPNVGSHGVGMVYVVG